MSCFGITSRKKKVWWCNLTATIRSNLSKLRRSRAVKWTVPGLSTALRRRARRSRHVGHDGRLRRHHQSFAPVYVDDLYNQPKSIHVEYVEPSTSDQGKARKGASSSINTSVITSMNTSPGTSILSVVKGMGEVDLRAELFIRKFKEEMRLQSHRSLEEDQEILARGL